MAASSEQVADDKDESDDDGDDDDDGVMFRMNLSLVRMLVEYPYAQKDSDAFFFIKSATRIS